MLISFQGVARPVALAECPELLPVLSAIMPSWPLSTAARTRRKPAISVRGHRGEYLIESQWLEETAHDTTAVGAACCLSIDLTRAFVDDDPSPLCLHCAAVEIRGRLIVFPNTVRAGKTTLVARLASLGLRVFADDAMPIAGPREQGLALGIAPRLRWPLPKDAAADFRAFVERHAGPHDHRYRYLALPPELLARHGSRAPLRAIVMLDRRRTGGAGLAPVPRGACLQRLLEQNFASGTGAASAVDRLAALLDRVPCFKLTYSDLDAAALLIMREFQSVPRPHRPEPRRPAENKRVPIAIPIGSKKWISGPRYRQASGIHLRAIDAEIFLIGSGRENMFRLNPLAAAIWRLLKRPLDACTIANTLCAAFPEIEAARIRTDVRGTLSAFRRAGLIRAAPEARHNLRR